MWLSKQIGGAKTEQDKRVVRILLEIKTGQPQVSLETSVLRRGRPLDVSVANGRTGAFEGQSYRANCRCDLLVDSIFEADSRVARKKLQVGMAHDMRPLILADG